MKKWVPYTAILLLASLGIVRADNTFTNIPTIRRLSPEIAAQSKPVDLEAQVLWVGFYGLFLFDGQEGIHASATRARKELINEIVVGDVVHLKGFTNRGGFIPHIMITEIDKIAHQPLPPTRPFESNEYFSTSNDCDWVSVRGRLISARREKVMSEFVILDIVQDNLQYSVQMYDHPDILLKLSNKMFRQVTFNAVVGTIFNNQRQFAGRVFYVNSADDFVISDTIDSESADRIVPIHKLMNFEFDQSRPVKIRGIVTSIDNQHLFIRGEQASLKATLLSLSPPSVQIGDQLLLDGYVYAQPVSPAFHARNYIFEENVGTPQPVPLELRTNIDSHFNMELTGIEATIIDMHQPFDAGIPTETLPFILLCRAGNHTFEAYLPEVSTLPPLAKAGAKDKLTGICHLKQHPYEKWRVRANRFNLKLRGPEDIAILTPAPWWTKKRLLTLLAIVLGLITFAIIWVFVLRRTVKHQTKVISQQIEKAAVMDERQRIARELHDNLDQGFVGASLQIRCGTRLLETRANTGIETLSQKLTQLPDQTRSDFEQDLGELQTNLNTCRQTLKMAQEMLVHCSEESRNSIHDLRGGLLERMDLQGALQETIRQFNEETQDQILFKVEGKIQRQKLEIERNLLLIAKEAMTNAIRHANPSLIRVILWHDTEQLRIRIQDDGCGFETHQASKKNRFGIQGMHERANKLGGKLKINSSLGRGTTVEITLNLIEQRKRA